MSVYVPVWVYVHKYARAQGDPKTALDFSELESQEMWAALWVLETEPGSSTKAVKCS